MRHTYSRVMITGATGYVGHSLARRFLQQGVELVLPVRASTPEELQVRTKVLLDKLAASAEQVRVIACDLSVAEDIQKLPRDVDLLVHSAADTRFNIKAETADLVNRDASVNIFHLARSCPNLKNLSYISTVYAAGEQQGVVAEQLTQTAPVFANHYERSKWESEQLLAKDFSDLPWQIHRVATVIADDASGAYSQLNAVHNTLKLLYYGLVSLVPGRAEVPIYLVCGDFVEQAISSLLATGSFHEVFHICHTQAESLTLEQFIELGFQAFLLDPNFCKRGIQRPLLVDDTSFNILAEGLSGFGSPLLNEAMGSMVPFARQLFISKDFKNQKVKAALPQYAVPDAKLLISNLVAELIQKKWKI